ncbi:YeiH family protein [Aneurinibacillus tyrosinisolvens]|uniref:YeiH family protein n=1 Tax=Aneurinibacillus tyrosinisolvens TaxID=1443435 RepID=UPI00063EFF67|nr:YeiH family protein [Aneurinibacillus tyrosinisolvens]
MEQTIKKSVVRPDRKGISLYFIQGVGITLLIAIVSRYIATLPFFSMVGQLVVAILLGMLWRAVLGVKEQTMSGTSFSSKKLLRLGIIVLGMRLNLFGIVEAGSHVVVLATVNLVFALLVVYGLSRYLNVDRKLSILAACGTAICGAAAVAAIAPLVKADDEESAVGVAVVAILGTIFTVVYTLLYPVLGLTKAGYGAFAGGTLHEIAHVIAAAVPGGKEAVDAAVIVKLTRVALLVPVALFIGWSFERGTAPASQDRSFKERVAKLPVPWFVFGFLIVSGIHTLGIIPESAAKQMVSISYLLLGMAMAGLGMNVRISTCRRLGMKPLAAGFVGSVLLSVIGFYLVQLLGLS